jgi:hypothetical protein
MTIWLAVAGAAIAYLRLSLLAENSCSIFSTAD